MYHIMWKDQERPGSNASCSRMTDEWWNVCLLCWSRDPSRRASIASIVETINTLQVCNCYEVSRLSVSDSRRELSSDIFQGRHSLPSS